MEQSQHDHTWVRVAVSSAEIPFSPEGFAVMEIAGRSVCLILHNNLISACPARCPHAGGLLSEGYVDRLGNIVCPVHKYKFSLATGRNTTGEGYKLVIYPVEERQEGIFIGISNKPLF